jgi:ferredoxin
MSNQSGAPGPSTPAVTITEVEPQVFIRKSKNSKYIIEYHRDACTGASTCTMAEHTFAMDDENKAILINNSDTEDDDEIILAAAQSCPVFAIIIKDAATGEQIFPPPSF